ncbi:membrane anchor subunit of succinate dehydrogenase, Sdh4 [Coemansia sp. RSA 989]|nr:CybS-domain-containing protein [Coemansia mojavensis]KAJ1740398.1 membrane anchor subunit of succinate dehydrogenase, Sdh4 [Coemansia sp. RSA 1086]KAJ1752040.1 membrane anchor subunit of succinate dehydrogenase, Sdh4 [Coemansia sp. RSA 1821]KAJ1867444.1 membrane anchor subunit of succinate dehydrogenase, Sdh4 [Coemansia sp. RSA 989]KAJ1874901.1 membrane anchor subunit of succinate dehydrogenase, Sdh4 [Coemansia sp. RSA 990]KAJ2630340.1 membrane anchor subunit of succinate dehydrogenase, Sdh
MFARALANRSVPAMAMQRMTLRTARPLLFKATQPKQLFGDEVPNPQTVPQPPANRLKGSYHWMNERAVSLISVPLLATAFVYGSHPINDMLLGIVLPVHAYMGFQQVLLDYFERRRWPMISRVLKGALVAITGLAMFGAWRINTTDVGLTAYFGRLWNANKNKKTE